MSEFEDYVAAERERLTADREWLLGQRADIDAKLAEIDREFAAVDAYEAAKTGKQKPVTNGTAPNARRARHGSIRETILSLVEMAPAGLSRREMIEHLGVKGDKSGEMSLSNALTAMVKKGMLVREGGKYHYNGPVSLREAAE